MTVKMSSLSVFLLKVLTFLLKIDHKFTANLNYMAVIKRNRNAWQICEALNAFRWPINSR